MHLMSIRSIAVYPRVYGGTALVPTLEPAGGGLSPRVRGNPHLVDGFEHERGSIPACTGEPVSARRWATESKVYPRVYGGTRMTSVQRREA